MKKILIIISIIIFSLLCIKGENVIIPNNAIRLRVIANSDSIDDQVQKNNIAIEITNYINNLINKTNNYSTAQQLLIDNYDNIYNYLKNYTDNFTLSIGKNYFPKKSYKGISYEDGYYDSIVVSLGKANGLNWWCVVYPPLCLINDDVTDVEYTTLVQELLNK